MRDDGRGPRRAWGAHALSAWPRVEDPGANPERRRAFQQLGSLSVADINRFRDARATLVRPRSRISKRGGCCTAIRCPRARRGGRMRGRQVRSTMVPCRPLCGSAVGPDDLGRVRRQRHAQHPEQATHSSSQRGRWPRWSGGALGRPEARARVPSKGGATPRFGAVLAPVPLGPAADPGGRSPFARDKIAPHVVLPSDHGGDALSITTATTTAARHPTRPRHRRCRGHSHLEVLADDCHRLRYRMSLEASNDRQSNL